jgi:hypothetical protein
VALRIKDIAAPNQEKLLKWIADLNPGLHTENWRVLHKRSEAKGQRLILFIERDSYTTIQRTGNKIYTGLSQGTVRVLNDPDVRNRAEPVSETNSVSEGAGDEIPIPPDDQSKADKKIPSHGTQSEDEEGHKMVIDTSPMGGDC